jgi:hypothetical protein
MLVLGIPNHCKHGVKGENIVKWCLKVHDLTLAMFFASLTIIRP